MSSIRVFATGQHVVILRSPAFLRRIPRFAFSLSASTNYRVDVDDNANPCHNMCRQSFGRCLETHDRWMGPSHPCVLAVFTHRFRDSPRVVMNVTFHMCIIADSFLCHNMCTGNNHSTRVRGRTLSGFTTNNAPLEDSEASLDPRQLPKAYSIKTHLKFNLLELPPVR